MKQNIYIHFLQALGKQFHYFILNFSSVLFSFRKGKRDNLITRARKKQEWSGK